MSEQREKYYSLIEPFIYSCEDDECRRPVIDLDGLIEAMENAQPTEPTAAEIRHVGRVILDVIDRDRWDIEDLGRAAVAEFLHHRTAPAAPHTPDRATVEAAIGTLITSSILFGRLQLEHEHNLASVRDMKDRIEISDNARAALLAAIFGPEVTG